ncbi:hypothetical protein Huta_0122 [Halorhabdus utahensis DSM 12940]|uniref:Uncharacterized protein n=1 Tax=Halorhabdus utahensis (strain DSM 12940 / JCM 11049 / AX-2) TaxID=519442 RepID=C7NP20_HALUD|nr:hypothetical protein [Halorhabdus utahensis]ACV10311.1 hypothetical protein Huta_0122 [Halorhabdus utahensis DSM 12940]
MTNVQTKPASQSPERSPQDDLTESGKVESRHPVQLLYPQYGPVEALVGVGVFYVIVDRMTPVLVEALEGAVPTLVPDPFTTLVAMFLWAIALLTLGSQVYAQLRPNPLTFESRADREAYLDRKRPTDSEYTINLVLLILGATIALLAWNGAIGFLEDVIPVVVELDGEMPAAMTIENALVFAAFFVGLAAYTRGLDRLVIGGMRESLYRLYTGAWE